MPPDTPTRRDFLKSSTVAGAGVVIASTSDMVRGYPANETLNIASIGAGGRASGDIDGCSGENIVALCDVDESRAESSFKKYPDVKKYTDFRVMLEKEEKSIDAVIVATPDHVHGVAALKAIRMGKHVYCEKPLTHNVHEAKLLQAAAKKYNVQTQMGNQGTASSGFRRGAEIIQSGAIGNVREVHVWTNRPVWPQATAAILKHRGVGAALRARGSAAAVPSTTAWDLWLGPAPWRPYDPIYAPFKWRGWQDYGTGALGDMACHTMNLPYMALKLGSPERVEVVEISEYNPETFPGWSKIKYEFSQRGDLMPCTLIWYDGGALPPAELFEDGVRKSRGSLMIGDKGKMYSPGDNGEEQFLQPKKAFEGYEAPEPSIPRSPGHHAEWIRAAKGGPPAMSNFIDYAVPLTEMVLLGNVAMQSGGAIEYDPRSMKIPNRPEAEKYLYREYRKGWSPQEI